MELDMTQKESLQLARIEERLETLKIDFKEFTFKINNTIEKTCQNSVQNTSEIALIKEHISNHIASHDNFAIWIRWLPSAVASIIGIATYIGINVIFNIKQ